MLFNFDLILEYLNRSALECLHFIDAGSLFKLVEIHGQKNILEIKENESGHLSVYVIYRDNDTINWLAIEQYIIEWLDLKTNMHLVNEVLNRDPMMRPILTKYNGLRLIGLNELFEALCWAVIGQQINLTFAYQVKRNLVTAFGDFVDFANRRYYLFPRPEEVLKIHDAKWKEMKFSRQKIRYIKLISELFLAGDISKQQLEKLSPAEAKAQLLNIKGIGSWSAEYVLLRCLHIGSAFPSADAGLHQALSKQLSLNRKPTDEELQQMSERWAPYQGYATFYLWRSLY